jgi:hypothetical protein
MVRRGGNNEEDGRQWRSLIEEADGEGGSKSVIPMVDSGSEADRR